LFLSNGDRSRINECSLELLESLGVKVDSEEVREMMIKSGAKSSHEKNVVCLPEDVVKEYVKKAPSSVKLENLNEESVTLSPEGENIFWACNALYIVEGRKKRELTSFDFVDLTRIADSLENVHAMVGTSLSDYAPQTRDFVGFRLMAENTRKHLRPCIYTSHGVRAIIEMSNVLLDGQPLEKHPIFSLGYTSLSPPQWTRTALESFQYSSGYRIPLMINGEPMAGGTSPVTLAGTVVLANAEVLSGIVIAQILEEGRPCIYNIGFSHVLDMQNLIAWTGSPETALLAAAGAEMAKFHRLPSASWMCTESMMVDSQSAYEKISTGLVHALSGVNIIWGIGSMESELSISPEQMVIDNEIAGVIKRIKKGINVDDDTLAIDIIKKVGFKGNYLTTRHTMMNFRKEIRFSKLSNRYNRESWVAHGSKSLEERARDEVRNILNAERKEYLTSEQKRKLLEIEKKWCSLLIG
jgi:trimethylamine--corrinoid protein Co-methyltransferase